MAAHFGQPSAHGNTPTARELHQVSDERGRRGCACGCGSGCASGGRQLAYCPHCPGWEAAPGTRWQPHRLPQPARLHPGCCCLVPGSGLGRWTRSPAHAQRVFGCWLGTLKELVVGLSSGGQRSPCKKVDLPTAPLDAAQSALHVILLQLNETATMKPAPVKPVPPQALPVM